MMQEIPLLIIIPLVAVFLIVVFAKRKSAIADVISILCVCLLIFFFKSIFNAVADSGMIVYKLGGWPMPEGINLVVDSLAVFMLSLLYAISLIALLSSMNWVNRFTDKWKYYVLFLLLITGITGVVISGDIFTLYVFLEIAAVATYALIGFSLKKKALFGSFGYMRMGMISSVLILMGIAISYNYLSTLSISDLSMQLGIRNSAGGIGLNNNMVMLFVSGLFLIGFALKAGLVPFHFWVADSHAHAITPVSMMLSAVIMPILGIYPMLRIFFNMTGITQHFLMLMMIMGILSMLVGVMLSLKARSFKRIIAIKIIPYCLR